jgi:hypothetical protein
LALRYVCVAVFVYVYLIHNKRRVA